MSDYDYASLLKRASELTSVERVEEDRFKIPKVDVFNEGNTTVFRNFDKVVQTLNRESNHLVKFFLGNIGTAGELTGGRLTFQGKIPAKTIQEKLNDYVENYVLGSECNRPDTHLVKKGRTILIRCDACGAFRAIGSMKTRNVASTKEKLKAGSEYELTIKDIGKRGDGVAFFDKYIIYVNGAVKGSTYKVKIEKISGNVAFGRIA